ncbi:hypothetical protein GR157_04730 [Burkholderia sp. 4701]|nr:hypothetical protein [Burkholderia sp. 4701]MXN85451.1 hypothetical protein [Burkholderia sp. 4812]
MFNRIIVCKAASACSTSAEVGEAEEKLRTRFPRGYAEYVTRYGEGVLGGDFVRIYPPRRILAELEGWRARIDHYWFWRNVLTKDAATVRSSSVTQRRVTSWFFIRTALIGYWSCQARASPSL